jgi:hypothetical protein
MPLSEGVRQWVEILIISRLSPIDAAVGDDIALRICATLDCQTKGAQKLHGIQRIGRVAVVAMLYFSWVPN